MRIGGSSMFFRRNQKQTDDANSTETGATTPVTAFDRRPGDATVAALPVDALRRTVDPDELGFTSTAALTPLTGLSARTGRSKRWSSASA